VRSQNANYVNPCLFARKSPGLSRKNREQKEKKRVMKMKLVTWKK
jgi:hypothetical protein